MSKNIHQCRLSVETCFAPLHPRRYLSDLLRRKILNYLVLDMEDRKCKNFFNNTRSMRYEMKRHINSPHRFIIHPFSKAGGFLEVFFFFLICIRYATLAIAYSKDFVTMELIVNLLWLFCMLFQFRTGFVVHSTKKICIEPKRIALHYFETYFVFDMIMLMKTPLRECTSNSSFHSLLVLLTIISYFARFRTIMAFLSDVLMYFGINRFLSFFIYEMVKLIILLHMINCIFVVLPDYIQHLELVDISIEEKKRFRRFDAYCHSILLVVCYFFGADYAMETVEPVQNVVLFSLSFVGRLYTLALLARVLGIFGLPNISDSKFEQQMAVLRTYVRSLQIPEDLQKRIVASFEKMSKKQYFDELEITSTLTDNLKTELFLYGARSLIAKHPILQRIPRKDLISLIALMKSRMFLCNDVIAMAEDQIKYTYFIASGTVAGYNLDGQEFMHLEGGDEFGITWLLYTHSTKSIMTWIALETTEVYCVTREDLARFFNFHPEVGDYFKEKAEERFRNFYSSRGEWHLQKETVTEALRQGTILETQRLRLFSLG
ncbi:potassium/sodium hyperpolarization-activated cyclic nucleotide-gated channel 2-like [Leptinotarsa decemlineata]|uniref:potassium/sodium hyperpolarization-activated cyclic nucleotide-gated channel 2-like n=1 Tax=Leptinotarsa decemlineata TaxID=7539 RepID=UPI003D305A11